MGQKDVALWPHELSFCLLCNRFEKSSVWGVLTINLLSFGLFTSFTGPSIFDIFSFYVLKDSSSLQFTITLFLLVFLKPKNGSTKGFNSFFLKNLLCISFAQSSPNFWRRDFLARSRKNHFHFLYRWRWLKFIVD